MTDILHWQNSITDLLAKIRGQLLICQDKKSSHQEKKDAVESVPKMFDRLTSLCRSFRTEMNLLGNSQEKNEAKRTLAGFREEEKKLKSEFEWYNTAVKKAELVGGQVSLDISSVGGDDIMKEALRIQDDDIARLQRLQGVVQDTKNTGNATNEMLQQQTEQLQNINVKTMGIKSDIGRANQLLTVYKRRIMTDRMIWVFIFLVFAAVITIIIYSAINPDQETFNVPDEAKPPTVEEIEACAEDVAGCVHK